MTNYVFSHASHQPAFYARLTARAQNHQIGAPALCFGDNFYPWIPLTDGGLDRQRFVAAENIGLPRRQLLGFGGDTRRNLLVSDGDFREQWIGGWIYRLRNREHANR